MIPQANIGRMEIGDDFLAAEYVRYVSYCDAASDINRLREFNGIINFDAEIADFA
ncbi:MAG: hypothetical protein ACR2PA_05890 [Hyphomicrobiaceae bacterium]